MKPIDVSISIAATPEQVWDYVKDIGSHVEWMADAEEITFTSSQTSGMGTTFDCLTKVGPIRLTDKMTITRWEENRAMGVRHEGIVTGEGVFTLTPVGDDRTVFAWREQLQYPIHLGGPIGAFVSRPVLEAIWKRNLTRLRTIVEARS